MLKMFNFTCSLAPSSGKIANQIVWFSVVLDLLNNIFYVLIFYVKLSIVYLNREINYHLVRSAAQEEFHHVQQNARIVAIAVSNLL